MKLNKQTLKRIIREELEEVRQSMLKPKQHGNLKLSALDSDGEYGELGYQITGAVDPVELEILLKKAAELGRLPSNMNIDMSVVDKTVYLKPENYEKYKDLKHAITAAKKLEATLQQLGLNIQRG